MGIDLATATPRLRDSIERVSARLVEREALVEALVLAAIAGEHVLVMGPPGTAKSMAVRAVAHEFDGAYFEYLLGRFTEPNEIFGPVDLRKLREGIVEVETAGMLPEADIAFIDEVFLGSTAILNTLLGILNERRFRRGRSEMVTNLRLCVGASNVLPTDPSLAAFADRFLLRIFLDPVPDAHLEHLLATGWSGGSQPSGDGPLDVGMIDALRAAVQEVDVVSLRPVLGDAVRAMRSAGVSLTDRRVVKAQRLAAASALLDGRTTAERRDLWVLPLVAPTKESQLVAREALSDLLDDAAHGLLANVAEAAAGGRAAASVRLLEAGSALLWPAPDLAGDDLRARREATLREIDATFGANDLPDELRDVRSKLVAALSS